MTVNKKDMLEHKLQQELYKITGIWYECYVSVTVGNYRIVKYSIFKNAKPLMVNEEKEDVIKWAKEQ